MAHSNIILICVNNNVSDDIVIILCNSLDILCLDQFVMFSVTSPHLTAEDSSLMYMYEAELIFNKVTKNLIFKIN